jgi:hypothetical protein
MKKLVLLILVLMAACNNQNDVTNAGKVLSKFVIEWESGNFYNMPQYCIPLKCGIKEFVGMDFIKSHDSIILDEPVKKADGQLHINASFKANYFHVCDTTKMIHKTISLTMIKQNGKWLVDPGSIKF